MTDADVVQQLVAEISSQRPRLQKRYSELKTTEERSKPWSLEAELLIIRSNASVLIFHQAKMPY